MSQPAESPGALVLDPADDVAVLLRPVSAGESVMVAGRGVAIETRAALPLGHKIALRPLPAGSLVRKYGEVIGRLTAPAETGDHVHVHNLMSLRGSAPEPAANDVPNS